MALKALNTLNSIILQFLFQEKVKRLIYVVFYEN